MEWKDEYSMGILEIDNQHRLLLRSISVIEESIRLNQGWSNTHYAILELIQLARMHFSFEEALMRMFAYPRMDTHQDEHQHFFTRLDGIERQSLRKSAEAEMIDFLKSWLTKHILVSDRDYAKHIFSGAPVVRHNCEPSSG